MDIFLAVVITAAVVVPVAAAGGAYLHHRFGASTVRAAKAVEDAFKGA